MNVVINISSIHTHGLQAGLHGFHTVLKLDTQVTLAINKTKLESPKKAG